MNTGTAAPRIALALATLLVAVAAQAERRLELGVRANALHTPASRIGDMWGIGITTSLYLGDGWFVVGSLDRYDFDLSDSDWRSAGITTTAIPTARVTVVGVAAGRQAALLGSSLDWFATFGIASGFADTTDGSGVDDAGNVRALSADMGNEIHLTAALGTAWPFAPQWSATAALRAEHRYIDLRIDGTGNRVRETTVTPLGAYLSLNYRF